MMKNKSFCENFEGNAVAEKSYAFALRVIKLRRYLAENYKEYIISSQVMRSGTSIGANIAEAQCAVSHKEFLSKMYIAFKEAVETLYWLDLLRDSEYITQQQHLSLQNDCTELKKLLASITKTMREGIGR
jgi:four helix bundle protein